jgi:hypothetical protein
MTFRAHSRTAWRLSGRNTATDGPEFLRQHSMFWHYGTLGGSRAPAPPVAIACLCQVLRASPNLLFLCEFVGTKLGLNLVPLNRESGVIAMKPSESIKPISFLKTHTADVIRDVNENRETVIITNRPRKHWHCSSCWRRASAASKSPDHGHSGKR